MSAVKESPPRTLSSVFRPFPLPLTGRQWFYLTFLQGVGAGFIDGGANFGIAYAMYHGQSVVRMWVFSDNTIAGDLGVTPIIQCLASMLITSTLVHSDLHASSIKPLPYVYPHVEHLPDPRHLLSRSYRKQVRDTQAQSDEKPNQIGTNKEKRGLAYYYWMLVRFIFEGTERNMLLARPGVKNWFGRFLWTAAQGAGVGIIFGFPIWCLAIVILGPIYGNGNMGNKWAPQVIKLVYGAIVGWVTNPVIAILALGSQADHHLIMVEHDEEESAEGESATNTAVDETIHENEEYTHQHCPSRSPVTPQTPLPPSPRINTSPLVRPSIPTRARASSNLSTSSRHRPPLTANVSGLSPLPPASMDLPPERPTYGRERGLTVSSMGSQYSYALGGSGGRAKRPRAGTSVSFAGSARQAVAVPQVMVSRPSQDVDTHAGAAAFDVSESRTRSESGDVFRGGSGATGPFTLSSPKGRTRSASAIAALGEVEELNQS